MSSRNLSFTIFSQTEKDRVILWRYGVYSVIGILEGALRILDS